jgi:hypothetical protein
MRLMTDLDDFAAHLARSTPLSPVEARRLLDEVIALLAAETVESFVVRRHRELKQAEGERNGTIYRRIADEVAARPFATAPLTERQIRRLIYG